MNLRICFLGIAITALSGCAVGPDFKKPAPPEARERLSAEKAKQFTPPLRSAS